MWNVSTKQPYLFTLRREDRRYETAIFVYTSDTRPRLRKRGSINRFHWFCQDFSFFFKKFFIICLALLGFLDKLVLCAPFPSGVNPGVVRPPSCACIRLTTDFTIPSTFIVHAIDTSLKAQPLLRANFSGCSRGTFLACSSSHLFPTNNMGMFFISEFRDERIELTMLCAFVALCVDVIEYITMKPCACSV